MRNTLEFQTVEGADHQESWRAQSARYARGMVALQTKKHAPDSYKTRGGRIACALGARFSGRERSYIMSPSKARKFLNYMSNGWDANSFCGTLIPPAVQS